MSTLFERLGLQRRSALSGVIPPSRSAATLAVSHGEALTLSMVYRAINIHAVSVKQMSLDVVRDGVTVPSQPLWVRQPNVSQSRSSFLEQTTVSLATQGNAYWEVSRDTSGRVNNLIVLNPLDVRIEEYLDGTVKAYFVKDREISPADVRHLSLTRVPGTNYGLGPIQAAQKELRGAIDTRDYATNWFRDSGIPNGVLKSDQVLSPDQALAAKEAWNTSAGAKNGVAVLGNGLTYTPVYLTPADAQFLENQNFNVTQIARLFGVPSSLMLADAGGTAMTYTNVEQDWIGYVRFSLMNYLVEIEDAFSSLLPRGTEAKFNVEALLRSDTLTRYNAHKIAIEAGFMSVDEVRTIEGL
jgi:HK97 family phage portal protein